eukprot:jgi/Tetstr1/447631/TSEL_034990.t1
MTCDGSCTAQPPPEDQAQPIAKRSAGGGDIVVEEHSSPVAWRDEVEAAIAQRRFQEAANMFLQQAAQAQTRGDTPSASKYFGNASSLLVEAGDYLAALESAQRSTSLCSDSSKGHYRAGQALMKLGRFHEAVDSYELASQAFLTAGQEEEGSAQALEEALRDAKDAAALADAVQDAQKDLIGAAQLTFASGHKEKTESVDELYAKRMEAETDPASTQALASGLEQFKAGALEEAAALFGRAIAADRLNVQAYLQLGLLRMTQGAMNSAQRVLETCIQRDPTCLPAYHVLGMRHESMGQLSEAQTACGNVFGNAMLPAAQSLALLAAMQLLGVASHIPSTWTTLALVMYKQGEVMKASDLLSESRKIEPNPDKGIDLHSNGLISLLLGFFMAIRGRRAEACSALTERPESTPHRPQHFEQAPLAQPFARLIASQVHLLMGDHSDALAAALALESLMAQLPPRGANWMNDNLDHPFWHDAAHQPGFLSAALAAAQQAPSVASSAGCGAGNAVPGNGSLAETGHQLLPAGTGEPAPAADGAGSALKPPADPEKAPPSFLIPDDKERFRAFCKGGEDGPAPEPRVWAYRRPTAMGIHSDPRGRLGQGFDIHLVSEEDVSDDKVEEVQSEGPVELQPYPTDAAHRLIVGNGSRCVETLRLYCVVLQCDPPLAYVAADGECFLSDAASLTAATGAPGRNDTLCTLGGAAPPSPNGSAVIKTAIQSLAELRELMRDEEELAAEADALWDTTWASATALARQAVEAVLRQAKGQIGKSPAELDGASSPLSSPHLRHVCLNGLTT